MERQKKLWKREKIQQRDQRRENRRLMESMNKEGRVEKVRRELK